MGAGVFDWPGVSLLDEPVTDDGPSLASVGLGNPADGAGAKQPGELANYASGASVASTSTYWGHSTVEAPGIYAVRGRIHAIDNGTPSYAGSFRVGFAVYQGGTSAASPGTKLLDWYGTLAFPGAFPNTATTSVVTGPLIVISAADITAAGGSVRLDWVWEDFGDLPGPDATFGQPVLNGDALLQRQPFTVTDVHIDHFSGSTCYLLLQGGPSMGDVTFTVDWQDGSSSDTYTATPSGPNYFATTTVTHTYPLSDYGTDDSDVADTVPFTISAQGSSPDPYSVTYTYTVGLPTPYLYDLTVTPDIGPPPLASHLTVADFSGGVTGYTHSYLWADDTGWSETTTVASVDHTWAVARNYTVACTLTNNLGYYTTTVAAPRMLTTIPPLRQWPRDDGLRRNPGRSAATSRQGSLRRGPRGTYT